MIRAHFIPNLQRRGHLNYDVTIKITWPHVILKYKVKIVYVHCLNVNMTVKHTLYLLLGQFYFLKPP